MCLLRLKNEIRNKIGSWQKSMIVKYKIHTLSQSSIR